MLISDIANHIGKASAVEQMWSYLDSQQNSTLAVANSVRPLLVAADFARNPRPMFVVVPGAQNALNFALELKNLLSEEYADSIFFYSEEAHTPAEKSLKCQAIWALAQAGEMASTQSGEMSAQQDAELRVKDEPPRIVVASSSALLKRLPAEMRDFCQPLALKVEDEYDPMEIQLQLAEMGYTNLEVLDGPGTFASHGGVIDVFPGQMTHPIRLDFFGDELEEIKRIMPSTGQAIAQLNSVQIFPVKDIRVAEQNILKARDALEAKAVTNAQIAESLQKLETFVAFDDVDNMIPFMFDELVPITDFIAPGTLCVQIEPRALIDDMRRTFEAIQKKYQGTSFASQDLYCTPNEISFKRHQLASYVSILQSGVKMDNKLKVKRPLRHRDFEHFITVCRSYTEVGMTVVVPVAEARARRDLMMEIVGAGLSVMEVLDDSSGDNPPKHLKRGVVNVTDVNFRMPFAIPDAKVVVLTLSTASWMQKSMLGSMGSMPKVGANATQSADLNFGANTTQTTTQSNFVDITKITFPFKPGDYVVHAYHGIALFRDIVRRKLDDFEREYMLLEYAEGDKLFVPVEQFGRVSRYIGPNGQSPRLTRLGTADWSKAMSKARKATRKMAFDLVDVYSKRAMAKGHKFGPDTDEQARMEADFPHQETADQLRAIEDIKADMEASAPMDRLVCGDVGFGKTEVALRAIFKCVQDGLQVMVLCPTTILAQQHFLTFKERLERYGVSVEVLSRFKTPAEQRQTVECFNGGKLDVLVGTHRLLSRDINPKQLGLLVIDEEQRFGVAHKEQLKNFRESVDVLTLTATPIPRTMQMASSGVRDMSLILTPPDERLAVDVHVGEWDPDVVSQAIRREMERGGQVYYISNRVKSIKDACDRVGMAAGEARIGVAHGQMNKDQLERVMEDFAAGELDVLVSTTIVENGIDNPNTNTLIIEDAQNLGLSQMYQLKGRVGRSVVQAYAYFLFPDSAMLTDESLARLTAIDEHKELASGLQIAMRDLEIRGAGNLLGAEQSGNVSRVGFDLFAQMLKGAIENAKGLQGASGMIRANAEEAQAKRTTTERRGKNTSGAKSAQPAGTAHAKDKDSIKTEYKDVLPAAVCEISVNIPGSAYLPDDYIENIDERVVWYRRLSSAQSLEEIFSLESELLEKYPDMPAEAQNLILKTRICGLAALYGISLVSVIRGKLVVEGAEISAEQVRQLKRLRAIYLPSKKRFSVSMTAVTGGEDSNLFSDIFNWLWSFFNSV